MTTRRYDWLTGLLLLGLWLAFTPLALAGGGQDDFTIRMSISKTFLVPGDSITITGTGAEAGLNVAILIVPDPTSGTHALASVEVIPDARGNFSAVITLPERISTGRYAVRAEQPPSGGDLVRQYYWIGVCVNECTGESLGSMLPDTGAPISTGASLPLILSGLLVSALAVRGLGRAVKPIA